MWYPRNIWFWFCLKYLYFLLAVSYFYIFPINFLFCNDCRTIIIPCCFHSEIRLMEIVEELCDSSSFDCNNMVEEHEEHFETWWFKRWVWLNACSVQVRGISVVTYCGKITWKYTKRASSLPVFVSRCNEGKQKILICTSGSALRPSKCAVQKEHLDPTATVSILS